jgi:predicted MFS family arabinose efflux permease
LAAACYAIAALCVTVMLADQAPPAQRGAVLGWSNSVGSIAIAVSATLSGPLFERFSPGAPFHVGSATMTLLLVAGLAHARLRATAARPALRRERAAD